MKVAWLNQLENSPIIAVVRAATPEIAYQMAVCAIEGGLASIEITWNTPHAQQLVRRLSQAFPNRAIGVGTILTVEQLQQAADVDAAFAFAPHTNVPLIQMARSLGIPIIPGALTPSEIVTAWQAGATAVKVFPIQAVGGAAYLQAIAAPLNDIPLIPTGGVTLEQTPELLQAGAIAVGLSSQLFPRQLVQTEDWAGITRRIQEGIQHIQTEHDQSSSNS
ncbi:MAG: bifunctional 4-hydroxy-2-oxoglutarate aldolase/2-dehydro-3-deoxy-phosphogluconate aldolase [Spirulina sp. SIO3F2]|nr:bifunctional 4-hydroxy-2-oxoglutarate aldolase/2-dehydro-3-deoxy-phosphogluconate aldolase [Spirulina sp. SIO3F2]